MLPLSDKVADEVIDIALEAGKAILKVYDSGVFETVKKKDDSPLTRADLAAHNLITERLGGLTPDIPILSEESAEISYEERASWKSFWLVDPLDGTKEFIKRNGEFTVNIALIEGHSPVFGVVNAPVLGTTYYGDLERGAFKREAASMDASGDTPIRVSPYGGARPRIVSSKSHRGELLERFLASVGDFDNVAMGSSLKICLVAEGKADLYPRLGPTMEWDTAAADGVLKAAGGKLTNIRGRELTYNKENLLNPYFIAAGSPCFPWQDFIADLIKEIETEELKR